MRKFLFVEKRLRNEKLGIMMLTAMLKQNGHQVRFIQTDIDDIDECMRTFQPDFIGYSLMTGTHIHALELNNTLKKNYSFLSVFGGPHCTFFPEIINEPGVDYVIQGAGEEMIVHIVDNIPNPGLYRGNLCTDINVLPTPDRSIIYSSYTSFANNPMKNIMTMRDCPYSCSYCYNHLWRKFYKDQKHRLFQRRSVENVIREIKEIKDLYPLEQINFLDDNFIFKKNWVKEFCRQYKEKIHLPFLISLRVDLVDEELISNLREAGLKMVNFAIESATPEIQKKILNRGNFSNDRVRKTISLLKQYKVRIRMQNMIGLPIPAPLTDALATLKFNLENQVDDSWVSIYQPYPRTKLGIYCLENGYISESCLDNCAESFFDESRMNIEDKDKIFQLQKWWYLIVRYKLPWELIHVLINLPLSNEQADYLMNVRFDMSKKYFYDLKEV